MKKTLRVVLYVFLSLLILTIGLTILINIKMDDYVRSELDRTLSDDWTVEFSDIELSLFSMTISVNDVLVTRSDSTEVLWKTTMESATVSGVHPFQIVLNDKLSIEEIKLQGLEAEVFDFKKSNKSKKKGEKEFLKSIVVDRINLEDGDLKFANEKYGYLQTRIMLKSGQIKIGSGLPDMYELANDVALRLWDTRFTNKDSTATFHFSSLKKSAGGPAVIDSLSLTPELDFKEFYNYYGWRKSRTHITVGKIVAAIPKLNEDSVAVISHVAITHPNVRLEKDLSYPLADRVTPMPQEMVSQLGWKFRLDSLRVVDGKLQFDLLQKKGEMAHIVLDDISASGTIGNEETDKPALSFEGRATALNGSSLFVNSTYSYGENHPWTLSGKMSHANLEILSDFIRKMAGIEISSGDLNELNFEMNGNTYASSGQVTFLYENLSIIAVDRESGEKKVLLNFLANVIKKMLIWKQNPNSENTRIGKFTVERNVKKGFASQWIDGLMQGVIETVAKIDPMKVKSASKSD